MALSTVRSGNAASGSLRKILASKGLEESVLAFPLGALGSSLRTRIAVKISDWKCCAAYLGVPQQDIDDIVEENTKERNRRISMLCKWSDLKGPDATCLKLLEIFAEMGRNDLIEFLVDAIHTEILESRRIYQDQDIDEAAHLIRLTVYRTVLVLLQKSKCLYNYESLSWGGGVGITAAKFRFMKWCKIFGMLS